MDDRPIKSINKYTEIYIDGASRGNPGESGIGILIIDEKGLTSEIKNYIGIGTNNQAEYKALIKALETAKELKKDKLKIFTDSLLVANQINGKWKVKHLEIKTLFQKAKELTQSFSDFQITHILRENNQEADRLANEAINEYSN